MQQRSEWGECRDIDKKKTKDKIAGDKDRTGHYGNAMDGEVVGGWAESVEGGGQGWLTKRFPNWNKQTESPESTRLGSFNVRQSIQHRNGIFKIFGSFSIELFGKRPKPAFGHAIFSQQYDSPHEFYVFSN